MQQTLGIIKPDAVEKNVIGPILSLIEKEGLQIIGMKMIHLTEPEAEGFYAVHQDKPFFHELVEFMCSGPIVVFALQGDEAIAKYRKIMGATNPKEAEKGTIRADYAESIEANAVHGSDSVENAAIEVAFFFKKDQLFASK